MVATLQFPEPHVSVDPYCVKEAVYEVAAETTVLRVATDSRRALASMVHSRREVGAFERYDHN